MRPSVEGQTELLCFRLVPVKDNGLFASIHANRRRRECHLLTKIPSSIGDAHGKSASFRVKGLGCDFFWTGARGSHIAAFQVGLGLRD